MAEKIALRLTDRQTEAVDLEAQYTGVPVEKVLAAIFTHGLSVWIELRERLDTIRVMGDARREPKQTPDSTVDVANENADKS